MTEEDRCAEGGGSSSTAMAGVLLLVAPTGAAANGGVVHRVRSDALPAGDAGVATTYVSVPQKKTRLFDRGPFYLFAVPEGMLREGRPIPAGAIRLGTFTIEEEKGDSYELRAEFTAPELGSGSYFMGLCNDPCTIAGFGEPLYGRSRSSRRGSRATLLTKNERSEASCSGNGAKPVEPSAASSGCRASSTTQLAFGASERDRMSAEIEQLESQLAAARDRACVHGRGPSDPWVVGAILVVTSPRRCSRSAGAR